MRIEIDVPRSTTGVIRDGGRLSQYQEREIMRMVSEAVLLNYPPVRYEDELLRFALPASEIILGGRPKKLSARLRAALHILAWRSPECVSVPTIVEQIYDPPYNVDAGYVILTRLRKAIGCEYIRNIRNEGYYFAGRGVLEVM